MHKFNVRDCFIHGIAWQLLMGEKFDSPIPFRLFTAEIKFFLDCSSINRQKDQFARMEFGLTTKQEMKKTYDKVFVAVKILITNSKAAKSLCLTIRKNTANKVQTDAMATRPLTVA